MTERTPEHPKTDRANTRTGEHPLASFASWVVLFASFGLSAATWIALADLAGFHRSAPVPLTEHFRVQLTWLMPVAVDGYVVVALVLWMSPVPAKVAAFAKKNTYAAALIGVVAQSAFHCASVASATQSGWRAVMAAVVGAIPPAGAALSVHMRALIRRESGRDLAQSDLSQAAPAVTVRRVIVPSGLMLDEQNAVANGYPITEQLTTPNGQVNGIPNTLTDRVPNTEQNADPIGEQTEQANTPNTPEPIAPNTAEANTEQAERETAIVRPITSARRTPNGKANGANGDTAKNLMAIKRRYRDWRTNMPSVRECAAVIGVATSTGKAYRDRLIAELNTEQDADDADDKERSA